MAFDGIITKSIISELKTSIVGGKITKVFQPNTNDVILGIYSKGKNYALHICIDSGNCRINLTTNSKPNPLTAPNFCMFLRKHIISCKIKHISNYDLERVVTIELEGYNELNDLITKKLIIELMGKHSNIILLNSSNMILDSLRHLDKTENCYRDILPAHEYLFPKTDKHSILETEFSAFYQLLENETINSISKKVSGLFTGISKSFVEQSLTLLNISVINKETLNNLFSYSKELIALTNTEEVSCKVFSNSNQKDDYCLIKAKKETDLSINFFIDDFYHKKETYEIFLNYRNNVLKILSTLLKKYNKRLENINNKLEECSNMEMYQRYGELITSNLYRIQNKNTDFIELENYYDNNNLIKIPLDNTLSPANNAKKYFKKYRKLKSTLSVASEQKQDTKKELDYIESIIYELEAAKTLEEIDAIYIEIQDNLLKTSPNTKTKSKLKRNKANTKSDISPIEYEINGYKVLVGKNNKQNDYLTFKVAEKTDLWFHTKDIHGSHVILRTNRNKVIDQDTLYKCSKLAANHSKAKNSSNTPVDYTFVQYIKKPSGAKPGKVVYKNQKTIYV